MRKTLAGCAALAALAVGVGGLGAHWRWAAEKTVAPPALAATKAVAVVAIPPAPPPPQAPADPDADLSAVDVPARAVHDVPADAGAQPAPAVSFVHRAAPPPEQRVADASPPPQRAAKRHQSIVATAPPLDGVARPADGASLAISGMTVRLFGVKPASARDRCGAAADCYDAARGAIAAELARDASVRCVVPPGQEGAPAYICHDSAGVDLGGLLVAEGLALADTSRSYQYVGAQQGARGARHGLWAYR